MEMNQGKHNEQNSELCLKIIILLNYNPFVKEMIFDSINVFNKKNMVFRLEIAMWMTFIYFQLLGITI